MKADILKLLLHSHAEGDESSFRKAALQLVAAESTAGHVRVADEIRSIIAKMPATSSRKHSPVVDIAAPRGELADILEGGHRDERPPRHRLASGDSGDAAARHRREPVPCET
ncbi:MAG: hypothetical protein IPG49_05655 [Proteobacteria bacterium]|nr:hypothetical protein [Pseudomonadota bacterium]